jgi:hypothetical protein
VACSAPTTHARGFSISPAVDQVHILIVNLLGTEMIRVHTALAVAAGVFQLDLKT